MEADIIRVGFQESIETHNLVYARFIGDGDSSVHLAVKNTYPGMEVMKIECMLHAIRNVNTRLTRLSGPAGTNANPVTQEERRLERAKKEFPKIGKVLRNMLLYFNQLGPSPDNIRRLAEAILNIPNHTFGCHLNCIPDVKERERRIRNLVAGIVNFAYILG